MGNKNELTILEKGLTYDQEQINLIKSTVAKDATNDELSMFLYLSKQYHLDPFKREIWFAKYKNKDGTYKTTIITSRDGYLKYAQESPEFEGLASFVVKEGDIFEIDAESYKVTHKFGTKRGKILGAWARCDRKGKKPFIHYAEFSEYNAGNNIWSKYPSAMIQKVAEAMVLKRAFGISGLVAQEEMDIQYAEEQNKAKNLKIEEPKQEAPKKELPKGNVVDLENHKTLADQKKALMALAIEKGLATAKTETAKANADGLSIYCRKELNIDLKDITSEKAEILLEKLKSFEIEKVEAEIVEIDGVELTAEEKKIIEEFTEAK